MSPSSPSAVTDVDLALVARVRVAVARLNRQLRQQSADLSPTVQSALVSIEGHGPLTLGDLAAREQIAPATVTKLVTKLVAEGLVERRNDPDDRRVFRVALTGEGQARLTETRSRRNAYLVGRLSRDGAPDADALRLTAEVLERLAEADDEADPGDRR